MLLMERIVFLLTFLISVKQMWWQTPFLPLRRTFISEKSCPDFGYLTKGKCWQSREMLISADAVMTLWPLKQSVLIIKNVHIMSNFMSSLLANSQTASLPARAGIAFFTHVGPEVCFNILATLKIHLQRNDQSNKKKKRKQQPQTRFCE